MAGRREGRILVRAREAAHAPAVGLRRRQGLELGLDRRHRELELVAREVRGREAGIGRERQEVRLRLVQLVGQRKRRDEREQVWGMTFADSQNLPTVETHCFPQAEIVRYGWAL